MINFDAWVKSRVKKRNKSGTCWNWHASHKTPLQGDAVALAQKKGKELEAKYTKTGGTCGLASNTATSPNVNDVIAEVKTKDKFECQRLAD